MDHLRPDALDPTQRQALLDYVSAGGVLMLNAPDPTLVAGSWLEPYLPVRMIGTRQMRAIDAVGEATPRPFVGWETCTEAVAAQGAVLLQDARYVHAAARPLGLGQVVFTSFPASTLDAKDDRNVALWRSLMNCDHRPVGVAGSRISTEYPALMEPMLGKHAAPWSLAAVVACGFVLLAGGAHLLWRGAARPKAFVVSLVMAVLVAATFGVLAAFRQETEPVQQARLSITDAWDGGFQTQEYAALSGPQAPPDKLAQQVVQENATLRPVLSRQDRLVLTQWPARLERLPIQPEQVSVVTLASRIDRSNSGIKASGRFAADGLHLNIDNRMGQPLTSSQLLWRTRRMGLTGVGVGQSQTTVGENTLRPADEYTASPGLVSQDEQHKGEILRSLLTPQQPMMRTSASRATIVGWMRSTPAATTAQGVEISRAAAQNLVRVPVDLEPSAPGDHVRIDGPFNHVVQSGGRGLPYDTIADEFGASTLEGTWAFVMQPPLEVGRVQPTHARISIDLAAPQQIIRLLKGKSAGNATSVLGSWQQATQSQVIEFDVTPADCDAEGRLLLQLSVQHAGAAGTLGVPKPWRVTRFNVDLDGDVVAEKHRP